MLRYMKSKSTLNPLNVMSLNCYRFVGVVVVCLIWLSHAAELRNYKMITTTTKFDLSSAESMQSIENNI